jgi:hypothetical protein
MDFPFLGIGISRHARDVETSRWFSASAIGSFKPVGDEAGWGEEEIAGELISFYAGLKKNLLHDTRVNLRPDINQRAGEFSATLKPGSFSSP